MSPRCLFPVVTLAAALLAGCAALNTVTSDVSSYGEWPAARAPGSYVFERLPSQQANPQQQAQLEDAARGALEKAGFTPATNPESADVTAQLGSRVTRYYPSGPGDDPFWWNDAYFWRHAGWHGPGWGWGWSMNYSTPQYEREVAVLLRDRRTGQPLYETHARTDRYDAGDPPVLAALFEAALKDFPRPAISPRRVSVQLPQH